MNYNLSDTINEAFTQYAGAVTQSRALVDVRDCLKPSARQIFYSLYLDKFWHNKPYNKSLKVIGSTSRFYIHGDSSCLGILMKSGQPFYQNNVLIDVDGNYGTLDEGNNWAASRYTSSRLSELTTSMFDGIKKEAIREEEWRENYDGTEYYPAVLPTKGYYNIVNGTMGIGVGLSASIPPTNLNEVNNALIKLLWNPDISDDELICMPDFPTGAMLLNADEVRESFKNGKGKACKIRAKVEYFEEGKERGFIVKEVPYSVYTSTICSQIMNLLEEEPNLGIDKINDLTGEKPKLKIILNKRANASQVLKKLYKRTSLQSYYGINLVMLKNGHYPKLFTWKEALQEHLNHEILVYTREHEYDLRKINDRIHILDGLIRAVGTNILDDIISTIKNSKTSKEAKEKLMEEFQFSSPQADAILNFKLARLASLEIKKLKDEHSSLEKERDKIIAILETKELLYKEIEAGLRATMDKYGKLRRTEILNVEKEDDDVVEEKQVLINLTNKNRIHVSETSSLFTQKRGAVGRKIKMAKDEYIIDTISSSNKGYLICFSENGKSYKLNLNEVPMEKLEYLDALIGLNNEKICLVTTFEKNVENSYIVFVTENGLIKKSEFSKYEPKSLRNGATALTLEDNDKLVSAFVINNENIGILSENGKFIICTSEDIKSVGKVAKGVIGMKLDSDDKVVSAKPMPQGTRELISITKLGQVQRTSINNINITKRGTKGIKLQKLNDNNTMKDFSFVTDENEIMVISEKAQIKIKINDIRETKTNSVGVKALDLKEDEIVGIA